MSDTRNGRKCPSSIIPIAFSSSAFLASSLFVIYFWSQSNSVQCILSLPTLLIAFLFHYLTNFPTFVCCCGSRQNGMSILIKNYGMCSCAGHQLFVLGMSQPVLSCIQDINHCLCFKRHQFSWETFLVLARTDPNVFSTQAIAQSFSPHNQTILSLPNWR